jgi:nitrate reductase gamma subunit
VRFWFLFVLPFLLLSCAKGPCLLFALWCLWLRRVLFFGSNLKGESSSHDNFHAPQYICVSQFSLALPFLRTCSILGTMVPSSYSTCFSGLYFGAWIMRPSSLSFLRHRFLKSVLFLCRVPPSAFVYCLCVMILSMCVGCILRIRHTPFIWNAFSFCCSGFVSCMVSRP